MEITVSDKFLYLRYIVGFPYGSVVKNTPANVGAAGDVGLIPQSGRSHWRRKWQPTPVFLPGKSNRQRNLEAYSQTQLSTAQHTHTHGT